MPDPLGEKLLRSGIIDAKKLEKALEKQKITGGRLGENLIALGYIDKETLDKFFSRNPPNPRTVEETGLEVSQIEDLLMKHMLFMGDFKICRPGGTQQALFFRR